MIHDENAELSYNPDEHEPRSTATIQDALAEAQRQLTQRSGVEGMGMTKTSDGQDAIVVYVRDQQALSQLPATVRGFRVIGEITGEIRAF